MELFRNLRVKAGQSMLAGKIAKTKRKPFYINFSCIKSIGLVWDASRIDEFSLLSKFHQRMSEENIEVKIFGYFPGKELPGQYTAIRYLTCLKRPDLDFFYRPKTSEAHAFTERRFDVLIDINFRKLFPLYYITALSMAGLKAGLADSMPESSPLDLMISWKKPVTLENFLDQVFAYLNMINAESVKKVV